MGLPSSRSRATRRALLRKAERPWLSSWAVARAAAALVLLVSGGGAHVATGWGSATLLGQGRLMGLQAKREREALAQAPLTLALGFLGCQSLSCVTSS